MAAPGVPVKGTASAGTATSVTPSYPASVAADDIIWLLAISHQPVSIGVINTPSGFAEVAQSTYQNSTPANQGRAALFWKRAAGGESGTVSVSRTGDTGTDGTFFAQMYKQSGCATTGDPYDAVTATYGPGNATVQYGAVTVSGSERTLLAFIAQADNASTVDPPSTYTGLVTDTTATGTDAELRLCYKSNVSTDGSTTSTGGETEGWATFHVSAKPPSTDVSVSATTDTLTVTEYAATVTVELNISATTDTLTITEYPATVTVEATVSVNATTDTLTVTEYQATVSVIEDVNVAATTDTLTVTEYPATVSVEANVSASTDTLTVTEYPATVTVGNDVEVNATTDTLSVTEYPATVTVEAVSPVVEAPTDSLGANDRHWRQRREKRRRVPTAEEVYRKVVNPSPPPLLDAPGLADIPDEVDREIAYRMRAAEAERLADRVSVRATKAKIEADMAAALLADQEDEEALFAIMATVLLEDAA